MLWRILFRALTTALVALPLAFVALWLALHHKPAWYAPVSLDEAGMRRARHDAVNTTDFIGDQMNHGEPFELVLRDRAVNEWLAALPTIWPEVSEVLPPEVGSPVVSFDDGGIRVGSHVTTSAWQAIVSVGLLISLTADGEDLAVELTDVRGGSLPVPQTVLAAVLDPVLRRARRNRRPAGNNVDSVSSALRGVRSTGELFEGIRIENRFVWFNGEVPFRIDAVEIDDGEVRLRLDPL